MTQINKNSTVEIDYVGKLEDGTVFDSTKGKQPLKVKLGKGLVIKGFEAALVNKNEGDEFDFKIPKDDAYGEIKQELIQEVPKEALPAEIPKEKGVVLQLKFPDGNAALATIREVTDSSVKIDMNHPLAGKDLFFHIKVNKVFNEEEPNSEKQEVK